MIIIGDVVMKSRRRLIIVLICFFVIIIGGFIISSIFDNSYLKEIKYNEVVEKIDNKESFVLLLSQTTCSHCMDFKPKLARVAKKYKLEVYYLETDLLDEDTHNELEKIFSFKGTPTTVFVIDGEEKTAATRINGDTTEQKIINKLKSNGFIN